MHNMRKPISKINHYTLILNILSSGDTWYLVMLPRLYPHLILIHQKIYPTSLMTIFQFYWASLYVELCAACKADNYKLIKQGGNKERIERNSKKDKFCMANFVFWVVWISNIVIACTSTYIQHTPVIYVCLDLNIYTRRLDHACYIITT